MKSGRKQTLIKTAYLGLFLSFAMILSYLETLLPVFPFAPGVKLGLANGFILLILYLYGPWEAVTVNLARVLLSTLLFGSFYSLMYSLAGALLSFLLMALCYRKKDFFSPIGIGLLGGLAHNIGQIAVAFFVTHLPGLLYYLPILAASGLACGALTGFLTKLILPRIDRVIHKG